MFPLMKSLPKPKYKGPILQLKKYVASMPAPPVAWGWEYATSIANYPMDDNDTVGDCEIARIAHMLTMWTSNTGTPVVPTAAECLAAYSAISGYVAGQPNTDVGCATPDVMNYWQNTGIAGHKIAAWAQVDSTNQQQVMLACWLFGGLAIDIAVYDSMMADFQNGKPWNTVSGSLQGYHAVPQGGYGRLGLTIITWAALQQMNWPTFKAIVQGAFVAITLDWIKQQGESPSGFPLAVLQADMAALAQ